MKRKLTFTLLALACAVSGILGLAACNQEVETMGLLVGNKDENYSDRLQLGTYVYGETEALESELQDLRFAYLYSDTSRKEVSLADLGMAYFDSNSLEYEEKPAEFYAGSWQICYYDKADTSLTAYVEFQIEKSTKGEFTAEMSLTSWTYGDENDIVLTFKTADGTAVALENDEEFKMQYMKKSYYDGLSDEQKKSYEALTAEDSNINVAFGENIKTVGQVANAGEEFHYMYENILPGEYVMIFTAKETANYRDIVTDVVEFTVQEPQSPAGKVFVLRNVEAEAVSDVPESTIEALGAKWRTEQVGKTFVFEENGTVSGTCNIGHGVLGELEGENIFQWTFNTENYSISVYTAATRVTAYHLNGELTLSVVRYESDGNGDGFTYQLNFTFYELTD